ncbi:ferritin-like domain-containing protein [Sphingomonas rubra]|uniref:Ferritin-like metal-binding protein YciE n=1 Tax=Sphingomonas rubra TaxID=634430 RepID=A0A1I5SCI6_9SPHN|nr:DUF892 family protein [Sphingomonas rubra]SFP68419.1 Ferritin-like metal-binding protein YciE [Sphingomonas rubra]
MALFGTSIKSLDDLFVHTLRTTYYAENQIVSALATMSDQATSSELKAAFDRHRAESQTQADRLERVFALHGHDPKETTCPAFDGIEKANDAVASDTESGPVLDAALAGGAQLVEHYEIAQYGKLIAWAKALGREDCASVLAETLDEEKATDERLSAIAGGGLNQAAAQAGA